MTLQEYYGKDKGKIDMKKIVAVLLAVLIIATALPVQSFAILDIFSPGKAPSVVSVEMADSFPVSAKETEKFGEDFPLSASFMDYKYKVKLSDGTEFISSDDNYLRAEEETVMWGLIPEKDKEGYDLALSSYVKRSEIKEALENEKNTISVYTRAIVYDYSGLYKQEKYVYEFVNEKELVDCFVEKIVPVSGAPEYFYDGASHLDFDATVFEITYGDGSTKQVKAAIEDEDDSYLVSYNFEYVIDGYMLRYSKNNQTGEIKISYLDSEEYVYCAEVRENPIKSVEVTNAVLDEDYNLKAVEYTVEWKDGRTQSYEKTGRVSMLGTVCVIDKIDGYEVWLSHHLEYPETRTEDGTLKVLLVVGEVSDNAEFVSPAITEGLPLTSFFVRMSEVIGTIIAKIANFCYSIMRKIFFND